MSCAAAQLAPFGPPGLARHRASIEAGIDILPFGVMAGGSSSAKHLVVPQPAFPAELNLCLDDDVSVCQRVGQHPWVY